MKNNNNNLYTNKNENKKYLITYKKIFDEKNLIKKYLNLFLIKKKILNRHRLNNSIKNIFNNTNTNNNLRIIDIACGNGENLLDLGLCYPNSEIIGADISLSKLYFANKIKNLLKIKNIEYIEHNYIEKFEGFGKFDLILSSETINNIQNLDILFKNIIPLMYKNKSVLSLKLYFNYKNIDLSLFEIFISLISKFQLEINKYSFNHKNLPGEKKLKNFEDLKKKIISSKPNFITFNINK